MNDQHSRRLQIGDLAPEVDLVRFDGQSVSLSQMFQAAPLALLFLRHLG